MTETSTNSRPTVDDAIHRMGALANRLCTVFPPDVVVNLLLGTGLTILRANYGDDNAIAFLHELADSTERDEETMQ